MIKDKFLDAIADIATDLKPLVDEIEADLLKTTQNNYGRYMTILSTLGSGGETMTRIVGLALIKAGANREGVKSALKICLG